MNRVFGYAKQQLWGMQFEPFTYRDATHTYTWNPPNRVKTVCTASVQNGMTFLAYILFVVLIKVS